MSLEVRRDAAALPPGTAVCMGAFDGLHLGHQALIERAAATASRVALLTFDPHPAQVIAPERMPALLYTSVQRERVAASLHITELVLLPFDLAMSRLSPEAFVQQYLIDGLRPTRVVVGADFRFGAKRAGTAALLRDQLGGCGIAVEIVDPIPLSQLRGESSPAQAQAPAKLSSTDIRNAVGRGDLSTAGALLGRWYALGGEVEHGAKRGRELGFPTANLAVRGGHVPPTGIYVSALSVWDPTSVDYGALWPAVTSIGHNPTFTEDGAPVTVETYAIDQQLGERLYGIDVEVALIDRLRGERKFDDITALVAQMRLDVDGARTQLDHATLASVLTPPERS